MTGKDSKQKPHVDHSLDDAAAKVHKDPRAADVGASGGLDRNQPTAESGPRHVDHGIDKVLKEDHAPHKDHGADPVHKSTHKDDSAGDVGSDGATHRK